MAGRFEAGYSGLGWLSFGRGGFGICRRGAITGSLLLLSSPSQQRERRHGYQRRRRQQEVADMSMAPTIDFFRRLLDARTRPVDTRQSVLVRVEARNWWRSTWPQLAIGSIAILPRTRPECRGSCLASSHALSLSLAFVFSLARRGRLRY